MPGDVMMAHLALCHIVPQEQLALHTTCRIIFSVMTEEQRAAHGAMRRANLNKRDVKQVSFVMFRNSIQNTSRKCTCCHCLQVLQTITGQNVSANVLLVMRGMAKVFVAELVEAGKLMLQPAAKLQSEE